MPFVNQDLTHTLENGGSRAFKRNKCKKELLKMEDNAAQRNSS